MSSFQREDILLNRFFVNFAIGYNLTLMNTNNQTIELLDREKIQSAIEAENQAFLARIEIFDTIDSTNTYLLSQAKMGASSGTICLAEAQTEARGRRGRKWFSMPGGHIACSMLWRLPSAENISGLSIAVAVMVANVLRKYGIATGIQLKWPNDVLFDGRKLAGILLERSGASIVIGIGLNLDLPKTEKTWVSIREIMGQTVQRNYLTGLLLNELLAQLRVYQSRGLAAFMDGWRRYDMLLNRIVTVHTPETILTGRMRGIDEQGELILQTDAGSELRFCYGEVSVRF